MKRYEMKQLPQAKIVTMLYVRLFEDWANDALTHSSDLLSLFSGSDKATAFTILGECVQLGLVRQESSKFYELQQTDAKAFGDAHHALRNQAWQVKQTAPSPPTAVPVPTRTAPLSAAPPRTALTEQQLQLCEKLDELPNAAARWDYLKDLACLPRTTSPDLLLDSPKREIRESAERMFRAMHLYESWVGERNAASAAAITEFLNS